jgi:hypothetical protein
MPTLVWHDLTAWLYDRTSASCVAWAEALQSVSHDCLTRLLQAAWSGPRLLELTCRTVLVWRRGYLIIDATVRAQPVAPASEGLAWVYSSQAHYAVYGLSLVLLVWTHGTVRLPLGRRLWHTGGPSKSTLALERLSYARNRVRCRPEYGLLDAWSPSKALLQRIQDDGWSGVCRLQTNRRCNGHAVCQHRRDP